jgi:glutamate carboxypeptidase
MADPWVSEGAERIARSAERELEALVGVSSPSGDVAGAEEAAAVAAALTPSDAVVEHPECSSPDHAPDLLVTVGGTGTGRVLLLGHLDTVIPHRDHRPLARNGERLRGSGTADMKGGVVIALGVLRELAGRPEAFAEAALLLVVDEEWRTAPFVHAARFAEWDACLCFEAGERTAMGAEGVVVRRKAAGTLRVEARGRAAHSGSAPDRGANALLALAAAAEAAAAHHAPAGPEHLTVVPTVMRAGESFNVVPAAGELFCDMRADRTEAFDPVLAGLPAEVGGAALAPELYRLWPGMDAEAPTRGVIAAAAERLGRPIAGVARGGASDASHLAQAIPVTLDGLGPRGGAAHAPGEFVLADSLRSRAEVALAVAGAVLA